MAPSTPNPQRPPLLLPAGAGHVITGPTGPAMTIKAGSADTADAYALIEYTHAAGAPGPPAHVHRQHEEAFYVLSGRLTLRLGDDVVTLDEGGFAVVPRGTVHQPSNTSSAPVRFFFITSPATDGFFVEMSDLMAVTNGRPSPTQLRDVGARWDCDFVDLPDASAVVMHNEAAPDDS